MTSLISQLSGRAVEALSSERDWDVLLCELARELRSTFVMINVFDRWAAPVRSQSNSEAGFDAEAFDLETMSISPRYASAERLLRQNPQVFTDKDMLTPEQALRDPWYAEHASRIGCYNWIGGSIPGNARLRYVFSAQNGRAWRDPEAEEIQRMGMILKSFAPAIELMEQLEFAHAKSALDLLGSDRPYAFIGLDRRLIRANEAMERVLSTGDFLYSVQDYLSFCQPSDHRRFVNLVRRRPSGSSSFLSAGVLDGFHQRIRFLPYANGEVGPSCVSGVLSIEGPHQANPIDFELFKLTYKLTPAEVVVSELIAAGKSTEEICKFRGVSPSTLRSQVLSLLRKTETSSRPELVALLMRYQMPREA